MTTVDEQHVHSKLGRRTATQYRRCKRLRKLPANFTVYGRKLPVAVGKLAFIRLVSAQGTVNILEQSFKVGKRLTYIWRKLSTKSSPDKAGAIPAKNFAA